VPNKLYSAHGGPFVMSISVSSGVRVIQSGGGNGAQRIVRLPNGKIAIINGNQNRNGLNLSGLNGLTGGGNNSADFQKGMMLGAQIAKQAFSQGAQMGATSAQSRGGCAHGKCGHPGMGRPPFPPPGFGGGYPGMPPFSGGYPGMSPFGGGYAMAGQMPYGMPPYGMGTVPGVPPMNYNAPPMGGMPGYGYGAPPMGGMAMGMPGYGAPPMTPAIPVIPMMPMPPYGGGPRYF
jgi:hypothetical protein